MEMCLSTAKPRSIRTPSRKQSSVVSTMSFGSRVVYNKYSWIWHGIAFHSLLHDLVCNANSPVLFLNTIHNSSESICIYVPFLITAWFRCMVYNYGITVFTLICCFRLIWQISRIITSHQRSVPKTCLPRSKYITFLCFGWFCVPDVAYLSDHKNADSCASISLN